MTKVKQIGKWRDMTHKEISSFRHDWAESEVMALFEQPFSDLMFTAHSVFRENFNPNQIQISALLSIKTGGCPENCAYCPQSAHYQTNLEREKLMTVEQVTIAAKEAKLKGASRFCLGAAWRGPRDSDIDKVAEMIQAVKNEGLETCVTLGLLKKGQAHKLKEAGLDFYNHNIDTSEDFYPNIITTRTFSDRLETLDYVRDADIQVCCGGIIGMGESVKDRAQMLMTLANMPEHPKSVPINLLIRIPGTPLENTSELDPIDFVRTIAVTRIMMPASYVRLSAGREHMSDECQALCFFAGANSIFHGEKLLTAENPHPKTDEQLFQRLGLQAA